MKPPKSAIDLLCMFFKHLLESIIYSYSYVHTYLCCNNYMYAAGIIY